MLSEKKLDELAHNHIMEFHDLDSREFLAFRTDEIRLYKIAYRQAEADAEELVQAAEETTKWFTPNGTNHPIYKLKQALAKWLERSK